MPRSKLTHRSAARHRPTSDALAIIDRRFFHTPHAKAVLEQARAEEDIARKIRSLEKLKATAKQP